MKNLITISFLILASYYTYAKGIPIPYGKSEEIIKVMDLPDTDDFKLEDGKYFDIGSKYTISHIVWLAYSNTEPQFVGYIEGDDTYLELSPEDLKQITELANITLPEKPTVSFFHKYGVAK